ncbi:hypothetical protein LBMAG42_51920 [Deltaproteobacteria bacterium]|nr:hypothetical protein LBMAG42_51920 [Deltaproteobacteria bacterium]
MMIDGEDEASWPQGMLVGGCAAIIGLVAFGFAAKAVVRGTSLPKWLDAGEETAPSSGTIAPDVRAPEPLARVDIQQIEQAALALASRSIGRTSVVGSLVLCCPVEGGMACPSEPEAGSHDFYISPPTGIEYSVFEDPFVGEVAIRGGLAQVDESGIPSELYYQVFVKGVSRWRMLVEPDPRGDSSTRPVQWNPVTGAGPTDEQWVCIAEELASSDGPALAKAWSRGQATRRRVAERVEREQRCGQLREFVKAGYSAPEARDIGAEGVLSRGEWLDCGEGANPRPMASPQAPKQPAEVGHATALFDELQACSYCAPRQTCLAECAEAIAEASPAGADAVTPETLDRCEASRCAGLQECSYTCEGAFLQAWECQVRGYTSVTCRTYQQDFERFVAAQPR